jgi:predicted restriction endonuclease
LDAKNPEIIELARRIGRSPGALAMKACNFASLDPAFRATNRTGLSGASNADRALWEEFASDTESFAAEAEEVSASLFRERDEPTLEEFQPPIGDTDASRLVRVRRVQSFFRAAVLTSYEGRCAVSGLATTEMLVASHIIPWSVDVERRADPRNGLCLNTLFDRAFDRGLITLDRSLRIVVAERLRHDAKAADLPCSIEDAHGRSIRLPNRFFPDEASLEYHRTRIFVDSVSK